jgi:hypothetical protein
MNFTDKKGLKTTLMAGDIITLKTGEDVQIITTNADAKYKILGGDAIVQDANGLSKVITEKDVNDIITLVFSIIRFVKSFFARWKN